MNKNEALAALRARNIVKVTIEFSGGNDEGGADGIDATYADGTEKPLPRQWEAYQDWDTKKYYVGYAEARRDATAQEIEDTQLAAALEQPIYDRWYSFAGDFYVHGTVTWDVATNKVTLEGQESVQNYESFESEY